MQMEKKKILYYMDLNKWYEPWRVEKDRREEEEALHEEKMRQNNYRPITKKTPLMINGTRRK